MVCRSSEFVRQHGFATKCVVGGGGGGERERQRHTQREREQRERERERERERGGVVAREQWQGSSSVFTTHGSMYCVPFWWKRLAWHSPVSSNVPDPSHRPLVISFHMWPCSRKRAVVYFGWVFFLISSGGQAPHVQCTPMGALSTCGEPDEIELTPMGVKLNTRIRDAHLAVVPEQRPLRRRQPLPPAHRHER